MADFARRDFLNERSTPTFSTRHEQAKSSRPQYAEMRPIFVLHWVGFAVTPIRYRAPEQPRTDAPRGVREVTRACQLDMSTHSVTTYSRATQWTATIGEALAKMNAELSIDLPKLRPTGKAA